jgi:hypothetical protein
MAQNQQAQPENQNVTEILQALTDAINQNQNSQTLALQSIKDFFASSPMLKAINVYGVYSFSTVNAITGTQQFFGCNTGAIGKETFGGNPATVMTILTPGGGTSFISLNGASNGLIPVVNGFTINWMEIREAWFSVASGGAGTCSVLFGAWVK